MTTDDADDEPVGYGKPPRRHQFQPGVSGNRHGRPKARNTPINEFRDTEAARLVTVKSEDGRERKMTKAEVAAHALVNDALRGDMSAVAEVFRLERKLTRAGMLDQDIEIRIKLVGDP